VRWPVIASDLVYAGDSFVTDVDSRLSNGNRQRPR
jgi:hypothetical protein